MQEKNLQTIIAHAKEYGYIFPSSEIYDGLQAVYDYGPNGVALKNNIKTYWWKAMTQLHNNIVGIDAAILMHPKVWKASGHADAFNDPLIDNKDSKKRYRADVLIEDHLAKYDTKISKEVEKAHKRFGDDFDEKKFKQTNLRVLANIEKKQAIEGRFKTALEKNNLEELKKIIESCAIACPVSGSKNWTEVRQFNLMFGTRMGSVAEDSNTIYLRPETAQGIFVNFLNVLNTSRQKIPFGIAQTGKAFRNEIVARQFIFRMKEFEQMEMQFFVCPGQEIRWYEYWKTARMNWHRALGFPQEMHRYHKHLKTAHYANAAVDIEFNFPFGFKELEGIHSRTDFDLSSHQELSGKKLQYFDGTLSKNYIPYVIETSIGLDRMFLAILCHAYTEEKTVDKTRIYLNIHPALAPVKAAILPLTRKDNLAEKAQNLAKTLRLDHQVYYEEKDTIGKRYTRQDLIGTPYCLTVDHQTLEDDTLTIRERNSTQQSRLKITDISDWLNEKVSFRRLLKSLIIL